MEQLAESPTLGGRAYVVRAAFAWGFLLVAAAAAGWPWLRLVPEGARIAFGIGCFCAPLGASLAAYRAGAHPGALLLGTWTVISTQTLVWYYTRSVVAGVVVALPLLVWGLLRAWPGRRLTEDGSFVDVGSARASAAASLAWTLQIAEPGLAFFGSLVYLATLVWLARSVFQRSGKYGCGGVLVAQTLATLIGGGVLATMGPDYAKVTYAVLGMLGLALGLWVATLVPRVDR